MVRKTSQSITVLLLAVTIFYGSPVYARDFIVRNATSGVVYFNVQGTTGNVGVSTGSPGNIFDVNVGSGNQAYFGTTGSLNNRTTIDAIGTARFWQNNGTGTITNLMQSSGASYFNGGNLGIGTTSPDAQLTVNPTGGSWNEGISVNPAGNGYGAIFFRQTTGSITNTWFFGKEASNEFGVVRNSLTGMSGTSRVDAPLEITTTGNAKFGGNVGINSSAPGYKLDVAGTAQFSQPVIVGTPTNTNHAATKSYVDSMFTGSGQWTTSGSTIYTSSSTMNVGIGTTNPNLAGWGAGIQATTQSGALGAVHGLMTTAADASGNMSGAIDFLASNNTLGNRFEVAQILGYTSGATANDRGGYLAFTTKPNGAAVATERMRIDNNGNVGIGITTPQAAIHTKGSSSYGQWKLSPSSAGGETSLGFFDDTAGTSNNTAWVIGQNTWGNVGKFGIGNLNGGAGGDVRLTIQRDGNVGIATTSPGYKLDVAGTAQFSQPVVVGTPTQASHATTKSYVDSAVAGGSGSSVGYWTLSGSNVYPNSTGYNVGIGTTSPSSPFHVYGTSDTLTFAGVPYNAQVMSSNTAAAGVGGGINLGGSYTGTTPTTFAVVSGVKENGTAGNYAGAMLFSTRVDAGVATEKMRITNAGNVGIGTTSPGANFEVAAPAGAGGYYRIGTFGIPAAASAHGYIEVVGSNATTRFAGQIAESNAGEMLFTTNSTPGTFGTTRLYIGNGGNVGINSGAPGYKLDVSGTGAFSQPVVVGTPTQASHATTKSYVDSILGTGGGGSANASFATITVTGNSNFATTGGNVGIGTTGPVAALEVASGGLQVSGVGKFKGWITGTETGAGVHVGVTGGIGQVLMYNPTGGAYGDLLVNNTITVKGNGGNPGNVGVGTTDSTALSEHRMFISKDVTYPNDVTNSQLSIGGATTPGKELSLGYDTNGNGFGFIAAGNRAVTWTNLALQPSGGNVGVGTTGPQYNLDIYNTGTTILGNSAASSALVVRTGASSYIDLQPGGATSAMRLNTNGNVGINSTAPGYKLDVVGTAQFSQPVVVGTPTQASHATTKSYVDSAITSSASQYHKFSPTVTAGNIQPLARFNETEGTVAQIIQVQSKTAGNSGTKTYEFQGGYCQVNCVTASWYKMQPSVSGRGHGDFPSGEDLYVRQGADGYTYEFGVAAVTNTKGFAVTFTDLTGGSNTFTDISGQAAVAISSAGDIYSNRAANFEGNVGIGTTTPGAKLAVTGGSINLDTNQYLQWNGNSNNSISYDSAAIRITLGAALKARFDNGGGTTLGVDAIGSNALNVSGNTAIGAGYISTAGPANGLIVQGNVGIGTTNPSQLLTVGDGTGVKYIKINGGNGASTQGAALVIDNAGVDAGLVGNVSAIHGGAYNGNMEMYSTGQIQFNANSAAAASPGMVLNNGNVGINSTAPGYKLDVVGNAQFAQPVIVGTPTIGTHAATKSYVDSMFSGSGQWTTSGTNIYSALAGNVGIGSATPGAKLTVVAAAGGQVAQFDGGGTSSSYIGFSSGGNFGYLGLGNAGNIFTSALTSSIGLRATNALHLGAGGDQIIETLSAGGNVGIGSTAPAYKLDVVGAASFTSPIAVGTPTAANHATTKSYVDSAVAGGAGPWTASGSYVYTSSSTANVGIGTTAPTNLLHVYGGIAEFEKTTAGGQGAVIQLSNRSSTNGSYTQIGSRGLTNASAQQDYAYLQFVADDTAGKYGSIRFSTANGTTPDQKMVIDRSGNVGIGTTGPTSPLDVRAALGNSVSGIKYTDTTYGRSIGMGSMGSGQYPAFISSNSMAFAAASTLEFYPNGSSNNILTFTGSGNNVDISNTYGLITISGNQPGLATLTIKAKVGQTANIQEWNVNGGTALDVIDKSGNVGINSTTPGYKLDVAGTAQFSQPVIVGTPTNTNHAATKSYVDSAITTGVSGGVSGTSGYHAKFTGANTVGNSIVYDNGTNVGIGTTVPTGTLQVGSGGSAYSLVASSTVGVGIGRNGAGILSPAVNLDIQDNGWGSAATRIRLSSQIGLGGENNALEFYSGSYPVAKITNVLGTDFVDTGNLAFSTRSSGGSWTERMRVTQFGNVGIGTTNPGTTLDMVGAGSVLRVASNAANQISISDATKVLYGGIDWTTGYMRAYGASGKGLALGSNGTPTQMYIDTAGNVGINSVTPGYKLDVVGTGSFSQPVIVGTPTNSNHAATKSYVDSMFTGSGQWTTSGTSAYFSLAGNVGIGSVSPTQKLDVAGNISSSGGYFYTPSTGLTNILFNSSGSDWATIQNDAANVWSLGHKANATTALGTPVLSWTAGNNVGIGTTSPGQRFVISSAAGGTLSSGVFMQDTGGRSFAVASRNSQLTFSDETAAQNRMVIDSTGNVGIGTTGPNNRLDVRSNSSKTLASAGHVAFFGSNDASNPLGLAIDHSKFGGRSHASLVGTIYGASGNDIDLNADDGSGGMTIQYQGNVGINSTSPVYKLDVVGTGSFTQPVIVGTPTNSNHAATKSYVDSMFTGSGQWTTSGTSAYFSLAGNVGIGTTTPGAQIDVKSQNSGAATSMFQNSSDVAGLNIFAQRSKGTIAAPTAVVSGNDLLRLWSKGYGATAYQNAALIEVAADNNFSDTTSPGRIVFSTTPSGSTSVSERMRIDSTGNVGINSASPGYKLDVNGTLKAGAATFSSVNATGLVVSAPGNNLIQVASNDNTGNAGIYFSGAGDRGSIYGAGSYNIYIEPNAQYGNGHVIINAKNGSSNVGIGSTVPGYKLDVAGSGSFTQPVIVGTPTQASHATTKSYVDSAITGGSGSTVGYWVQTGSNISNSNAGNVGIGTTSPGSILTIDNPTGRATGAALNNIKFGIGGWDTPKAQNAALDGGVKLDIYNNASNQKVQMGMDSGANLWFNNSGTGSGGYAWYTSSDNVTAPTAKLTVLNNGNVGIGLTNPGAKLTIKTDATDPGTYDDGLGLFVSKNTASDVASIAEFRHDNLSQGVGIGYASVFATGYNTNQDLKVFSRGTGNLLLNPSSGNVGIGQGGAASYKLDVVGTGSFTQPVIVGTPTNSNHAATKSYVDSMFTGSGQWTTSGSNAYFTLAGNVGIGTTVPAQLLDVGGNARIGSKQIISLTRTMPTVVDSTVDIGSFATQYTHSLNMTIAVNDSGFSAAKNYVFASQYDQTAGAWRIVPALSDGGPYGGNNFVLEANQSAYVLTLRIRRTVGATAGTARVTMNYEGDSGAVFTASTATASGVAAVSTFYPTAMITQAASSVGIGTTNPQAPLQIGSTLKFNTPGYSVPSIWGNVNTLYIQPDNQRTMIGGNGFGTQAGTLTVAGSLVVTDTASGNIPTLVAQNGGNVGIGSTTPGFKLDVVGNAQFAQPVIVGTPTIGTHAATKSYVDSMFSGGGQWTTSGTNIYSALAGNVGIGSATPGAKLTVLAAAGGQVAQFDGGGTASSYIGFSSGGNFGYLGLGNAGNIFTSALTSSIGLRATNALHLGAGGDQIIETLSALGNVGIGSTAPAYKLDVVGTGSFSQPVVVGTPSAGNHATTKSYVDSAVSGGGGPWTLSGSSVYVTNTANNVGIGTTNPSSKLVIGNIDNFTDGITIQNTSNYKHLITAYEDGVNPTTGSALQFKVSNDAAGGNTAVMTLKGSGNVGIGTATPASKLFVGSGTPAVTSLAGLNVALGGSSYISASNGTENVFMGSDGSGYGIVGTLSNHPLGFRTNNSERVRIDTNGNMGIGSVAPGYKLDVTGTFHATGVSTLDSNLIFTQSASARNIGVTGTYDPTKLASIWSMGNAFQLGSNGTAGNLYGLSYSYEPDYGGAGNNPGAISGLGHQMQWRANGVTQAAIGTGIWTSGTLTVTGSSSSFSQPLVVGTPTIGTHAATKSYVDSAVTSGVNSGIVGTTSYIPKFTSANVIGNSIMYDNGTNIGIGTTTPSDKLVVQSTTAGSGVIAINDYSLAAPTSALPTLRFGISSSNGFTTYDAARIWAASTAVDKASLNFSTYNNGAPSTAKVTIDGGGNLGIGSTSPAYKLDVNGTGNFTQPVIVGTPTAAGHATTKSYVDSILGTAGGGSANASFATITVTGNSNFATTGGSVGIGTTAPGAKLEVNGDLIMTSGGANSLVMNRASIFFAGNDDCNAAVYSNFSSSNCYVAGHGSDYMSINGYNGISFITRASGDNVRMAILDNGNVGVGTTSPIGKLNVFAGGASGVGWSTGLNIGDASNYSGFIQDGGVSRWRNFGAGGYDWWNSSGGTQLMALNNSGALTVSGSGSSFTQPVTVGTPTSAGHATTKSYVDSALSGTIAGVATNALACSGDATCEMNGANLQNGNITGVNKLTVATIDPVYSFGGTKYATFASSMIGVKEEVSGRGKTVKNGQKFSLTINFPSLERGSDLWVWYQAVDFSKDNIEAVATPYGQAASVWYVIDGSRLTFYSDKATEFSYRLTGKRHDWQKWPTKLQDQTEQASFTLPIRN